MATVRIGFCTECGQEKTLYNFEHTCHECQDKKKKQEKYNFLENLRKGMTIEQRINKIEEMLYDEMQMHRNHLHSNEILY